MTYRIEKLCKVHSTKHGDQLVWRPTRPNASDKPYEWGTEREAEAFLGLFFDYDKSTVRVVKVETIPAWKERLSCGG